MPCKSWWGRRTLPKELSSYAPEPSATDGEAENPGPRNRRRGPRSEEAKFRRASQSDFWNSTRKLVAESLVLLEKIESENAEFAKAISPSAMLAPVPASCPFPPEESSQPEDNDRPAKRARISPKLLPGTVNARPKREEQIFSTLHANLDGFKTHGIDVQTELELMKEKPG